MSLRNETLVPFAEVPTSLPRRNGKKINLSTLWRWRTKGLRGQKLESIIIGGRRYTTKEALQRFDAAVQKAIDGPSTSKPTTKQLSEAHELALAKLGRRHA